MYRADVHPHQWSVHDLQSSTDILDELELYRLVTGAEGPLIGFFCQESAACVRGMNPDPGILDVGVGGSLPGRPGSGLAFGELVLEHQGREYPGGRL